MFEMMCLVATIAWLLLTGGDPAAERADVFADGESVASSPGDTVVIRSTGVELSYDVTEIRAPAGDTLTVRYDNSRGEMIHNFVLVRSDEDITPVGSAALEAHRNEYIPEDEMERILAYSRLVYPGETVDLSFVVPPPGTYPYICTYSGHFTMMQGRLISTE